MRAAFDRTQTETDNADRRQTGSHNADRTQTGSHNTDRTQTESDPRANTDRTQTDLRLRAQHRPDADGIAGPSTQTRRRRNQIRMLNTARTQTD